MESILTVVSFLTFVVAALFIVRPFLEEHAPLSSVSPQGEQRAYSREKVMTALTELEEEFRGGKISELQYREQHEALMSTVVAMDEDRTQPESTKHVSAA